MLVEKGNVGEKETALSSLNSERSEGLGFEVAY